MREAIGDLWSFPCDAICIPVNWRTRRDGTAVMGAGVAKQAAERYPDLALHVGDFIGAHREPCAFTLPAWDGLPALVAVPTKRDWRAPSDVTLIGRSARALAALVAPEWQTIALPRLGCGLGGLRWEDVWPILASALDDRFVVVTPEPAASPDRGAGAAGEGA